jgi:UDP-N-acetylmuramoyl-L-alanyl-D-glutamate--2,6-diaminopimelate ligase
VVDYAHTPDQLEKVYQTFSSWSENSKLETQNSKLICVLGSCGGGRDKWKRPVLGKIASQYCAEIIITNEDPYDEDPLEIMEQVASGIEDGKYHGILDRKEAIRKALELTKKGDTVIITGKGSESLMCLANSKKIPWSDSQIVKEMISSCF